MGFTNFCTDREGALFRHFPLLLNQTEIAMTFINDTSKNTININKNY